MVPNCGKGRSIIEAQADGTKLLRRQSVDVHQSAGRQPDTPIAYIGGLDHQLLRDLALHTNIPLVDARRPAAVRIDPGVREVQLSGERKDSGVESSRIQLRLGIGQTLGEVGQLVHIHEQPVLAGRHHRPVRKRRLIRPLPVRR